MADDGSIVGGLMGLKDPDLLLNVGLGLMSAARYGGNAGIGLMQGLQNYGQQRASSQQYQMGQLDLARQRMLMGAAAQQFGQGQPQGAPQGAPPPQGMPAPQSAPQGPPQAGLMSADNSPPPPPFLAANAPAGGLMGGQGGSAAPQGPPQLPPGLTPPSQNDIYNASVGGISPGFIRGSAILSGRDPMATIASLREQQLKLAQQQYGPAIAKLDTLVKSDSPAKYMQADQELRAAWTPLATKLGMDPVKDLNDQNVRTAFTFGRNALSSSLSQPSEAPNVPLEQIKGPLNSMYSRNPVNNEVKQEKGEEELKPVIGKDDQPTLVPASQAVDMQPYNASIFGAANMSDQALQFAADTYRSTGKFPSSMGRSPAMQAKVLNKVAADAAQNGDTAGAIAARTGALKANGMALDQITKLESATTAYYNTMDKNLTKLQDLAGKVDSSGSPLINKVYRAWQQGVSGDPQVSQYVAYLNSVQSEFAKINSGSLGNQGVSDAARGHADEVINKFMSAGQIQALAEAMRGEGGNRLTSIKEQKQGLFGSMGVGAPGAPGTNTSAPTPGGGKTLTYDPASGTFK